MDLRRVHQFFKHPTRFLLSQELKLRFRRDDERLQDREPMELEPLAQWTLKSNILTEMLDGGTGEGAYQRFIGEGQLPLGQAGRVVFETAKDLANLVCEHRMQLPAHSQIPLRVDVAAGACRLFGQVSALADDMLVFVHASNLRNHHLLSAWLDLLAAHAATGGGIYKASIIHCRTTRGRVEATTTHLQCNDADSTVLGSLLQLAQMAEVRPHALTKLKSRMGSRTHWSLT